MPPASAPSNTERLVQALQREAVRALRRLPTDDEYEQRRLLRTVADALVKLRALHTTKDGRPDWRGQSWEYRQRVNEIYNEAHVPPEANHPIKASVRYHLGNALRENLTAEELEEAGLNPLTPRDRQYQRFLDHSNLAEFARNLIYHIEVRPNVKAPEGMVAKAEEVANRLNGWIVNQRRMSSE